MSSTWLISPDDLHGGKNIPGAKGPAHTGPLSPISIQTSLDAGDYAMIQDTRIRGFKRDGWRRCPGNHS